MEDRLLKRLRKKAEKACGRGRWRRLRSTVRTSTVIVEINNECSAIYLHARTGPSSEPLQSHRGRTSRPLAKFLPLRIIERFRLSPVTAKMNVIAKNQPTRFPAIRDWEASAGEIG
jgi:hypothetical protein